MAGKPKEKSTEEKGLLLRPGVSTYLDTRFYMLEAAKCRSKGGESGSAFVQSSLTNADQGSYWL